MGSLVTTALLQPAPGRSFHPRLEAFPDVFRAPGQLPIAGSAPLPAAVFPRSDRARRGSGSSPRIPARGGRHREGPRRHRQLPAGRAGHRAGETRTEGETPTGCGGGTAANSPEPSLPRTGPESRRAPANRQGEGRGAAPRPPRRPPPLPAVPTEKQGREPHGRGAARSWAQESRREHRGGRVTEPNRAVPCRALHTAPHLSRAVQPTAAALPL